MTFLEPIIAGLISLLSVFSPTLGGTYAYPVDGGTGTDTVPSYGQVLVGQADGTYEPQATSTLGITGGTGGASFPFTPVSYGNATSTTLGFLAGFLSTASSTINANATTTGMQSVGSLFINNERFTDLTGSGLTITASALTVDDVTPAMLQSADFGDFTCNGVNCALDADTVAESELDLTAVTLADFTNDAGFLTTVDISANTNLGTTYPLVLTNDTLSVAFGTTTSNTWAGTQTFTNSPVFTSLTGGLVYSNASSDTVSNVGTTTFAVSGFPASLSGTLGNLVGGSNSTLTWWGVSTSTGLVANQIIYGTAANTIGNEAAFTYDPTTNLFTSTNASTTVFSTGYASSTVWRGGGLTADCDTAATSKLLWDATTGQFSCGTDQTSAGGGITAIGPSGQTQIGPTVTTATSTASFNGLTLGTTIVGSGNTLTWTPSLSGTLGIGGGGTGASSFTSDAVIYEDAGVLSSDGDFIYDPTANAGNGTLFVNQIESGAGQPLTLLGTNGAFFDSAAGDVSIRANGELYLSNDNGSTRVGINTGLQTVDGTIISVPDTAGAADTFCLETLANCGGSGSPAGSDGQIQYNNGGAFGGAAGLVWDDVNSKVGVGTSSPWGVLSVEGSTGWEAPVFAFGTTSGGIYSALMSGFASSSSKGARNIEGDTGARVSIGRPQTGVSNPFALFVSGPISSSWKHVACNPMPWLQASITADTNSVCGTMAYDEVSAGTLANVTSSATSMHGWSSTITSGTVADGSVLYLSGGVANYGTTTPILEGVIGPANTPFSTTTTRFFGFANNTAGPTVGQACGFIATSTTSTWRYICSNGGVMSIGDTGISTTTTEAKVRVEFTSATKVNFYIKTNYYSPMTYLGAHTIAWSNTIYPVHGVYRAAGGTAIAPVLSLFGYSYWVQSLYDILE